MASSTLKSALARVAVTALACAVAGVWAYRTGAEHGRTEVQAKWDAERAAHARAVIAAIEARDRATAAMATRVEALTKEHRREINRIAADRDRLLDSLRERPERPSGGADLPDRAAAGSEPAACTGAELYRDDAAFLVRLAADADQLRAAVGHCQAAYDAVRAQLLQLQPPPSAD